MAVRFSLPKALSILLIRIDKKNGGKLYENLRQKRKYRKKRLLEGEKRGVIPNKVMMLIDHQKLKQGKDMETGKEIQ